MKVSVVVRFFGRLVMYPLVMTWWLLLLQFTNNISQLTLDVLWLPLAIATAVTGIIWLGLRWITRDWSSSGLLTAYIMMVLLAFGYIQEIFARLSPALFSGKIILIVAAIGFGALVVALRAKWLQAARLTSTLNVIAGGFIAFNLVIIIHQAATVGLTGSKSPDVPAVTTLKVNAATAPDIYYFVPDRYPNNDTLKRWFDFDNSEFLDALNSRGFKVYDHAHSNYQFTTQSLASTLNGEYLDQAQKKYQGKTTSLLPLQAMIRDNWVQESLKAAGYLFANVGSWWGPTRSNPHADYSTISSARTYKILGQTIALDEYSSLVVGRSILQAGIRRATRTDLIDVTPQAHADAFQAQIKSLHDIANMHGKPKFVFAHFLMPHPPLVYDAAGNFVDRSTQAYDPSQYVEQVKYTNSQLLAIIDYITSHSQRKPIFIIQADEGPYPGEGIGQSANNLDWAKLSDEEIQMKMGTLRAVEYPDRSPDSLPQNIPAVDQFRYLFDNYFGTNLPLLPLENYFFSGQEHPYDYRDVTGIIRSSVPTPIPSPTPSPTPKPE